MSFTSPCYISKKPKEKLYFISGHLDLALELSIVLFAKDVTLKNMTKNLLFKQHI